MNDSFFPLVIGVLALSSSTFFATSLPSFAAMLQHEERTVTRTFEFLTSFPGKTTCIAPALTPTCPPNPYDSYAPSTYMKVTAYGTSYISDPLFPPMTSTISFDFNPWEEEVVDKQPYDSYAPGVKKLISSSTESFSLISTIVPPPNQYVPPIVVFEYKSNGISYTYMSFPSPSKSTTTGDAYLRTKIPEPDMRNGLLGITVLLGLFALIKNFR